jgi:predicted HicB family RNase H-like nuclease
MMRAGVQAPAFAMEVAMYQSYVEPYVGRRFGRWMVIDEEKRKRAYFCLCRCDCGTVRWVRKGTLKNGTSKSCGCGKTKNNELLYRDSASLRQLGNTTPYKSNKLGIRGISLKEGKYRVQICMHGKQVELGCFSTLEEAVSVRRKAEEQYKNEVLKGEEMSTSEAQKKATRKYQASLKTFTIKLKPEVLQRYQEAAKKQGKTFRNFILSAMDKAMADEV